MLVDSHCHLDFPAFEGRTDAVIARAVAAGVGRMVTISTHVARFDTYRALAEQHEEVFFTVGTHPHNAVAEPDTPLRDLVRLAQHPRCVAIGEAGLDFHYDQSPHDVQRRVFLTHIAAARETGLPLVIHARDADREMIDTLTREASAGRFSAVLHCFSSGADLARVGLDLGFSISFSGILTFRRSEELRRIAALTPPERLLMETDAPYLAPEPHRGRVNEPAHVVHTAAALADVLGLEPDAVAQVTTDNFYTLFAKAWAADHAAVARAP